MLLISGLMFGDRGSSLIPEGLGSTFGGAVPSKAGVGSVSLGMGLCGPFPSPSTVCSLSYIFSTLIVVLNVGKDDLHGSLSTYCRILLLLSPSRAFAAPSRGDSTSFWYGVY